MAVHSICNRTVVSSNLTSGSLNKTCNTMAEPKEATGTIVNLIDRGQQIVQHVDLYSEFTMGAGQLACDGRFASVKEAKTTIDSILEHSPIEPEGKASSPLSVNRFASNYPWGKPEPEPGDPYPTKASHMVLFGLNFDFGNDFCYIDLGIKWPPYRLASGAVNPDYPLGKYKEGDKITTKDLKILRVTMCTLDDAEILVKDLELTDPRNLEIIDATRDISDEQLEALELESEDEKVATAPINGQETILVKGNTILTVKDSEVIKD